MVPTIKELADRMDNAFYKENGCYQSITEPMLFACKVGLEYAELHRQECLKQASEKAKKQFIPTGGNNGYFIVNKDSILNSYSKKNIR